MTAKLSPDLLDALRAAGQGELEVVDPDTNRTYLIVDSKIHRRATEVLRRQQNGDAIARGIAEMEAGQGISVEEARRLTRERLLARER